MKKLNQLTLTLVALSTLAACSKTGFSSVGVQPSTLADIPQDPPPVSPVTNFKVTNGACASDSSTQVLSCLKCEVPAVAPQPPQLSAKAQALLDIMTLSCQVSNKSDLNNFRPTRAMILNKLNRASEANYPETTRTSQMALVIEGLSNPTDDSLRKTMFGGLWYQPPYSDAFETYFGLTTQEAKSTFCWNGDKMSGVITDPVGVYSKAYMDCQYTDTWYNCKETPAYVAANTYRTQLQNSLKLGVTNPYVAPTPAPQKKCSWDKFEGNDIVAAIQQLKTWKAAGKQVSLAYKNASGAESCGIAVESSLKQGMSVQLATYKCE